MLRMLAFRPDAATDRAGDRLPAGGLDQLADDVVAGPADAAGLVVAHDDVGPLDPDGVEPEVLGRGELEGEPVVVARTYRFGMLMSTSELNAAARAALSEVTGKYPESTAARLARQRLAELDASGR